MIPEINNFIRSINSKRKKLHKDYILLKFFVDALMFQRISVTWYWNCKNTWEAYTDDDQKTITDAFTNGEKSATLTIRGSDYNISFYNKEGYFSPVQIRKRDGKNLIRKVDYFLSLGQFPDGLVAPASEHASALAQLPAPPSYEEFMKNRVTKPPLMTLV